MTTWVGLGMLWACPEVGASKRLHTPLIRILKKGPLMLGSFPGGFPVPAFGGSIFHLPTLKRLRGGYRRGNAFRREATVLIVIPTTAKHSCHC